MTADPYQAARISSHVTAKTINGKSQGTGSRSLHACPGSSPRKRAHPRLGDAVVDTTRLVTPLQRARSQPGILAEHSSPNHPGSDKAGDQILVKWWKHS